MLTPNLSLPYIAAAQAQKHVTHNEAIRALDALVQLTVKDRHLATPPATPADGDRYIVAPSPTGAWTGHANHIAAYQDGAWAYLIPREGWSTWIADEDRIAAWTGTTWTLVGGDSVNPTPLVGVNATADAQNRLTVASPGALFTHAGADHRLAINKASSGATASVLFQSNYAGRAEFGLTGDDNWHVKTSADGAVWQEALVVDRASGQLALPNGGGVGANVLINGDFAINQRQFAGGALAAGTYGHDRWKADTGGATYSVAAGVVTLASGTLVQIVEPLLIAGRASLASTTVTLSVLSPSADLTITVGSVSATLTAGSGRRSVTLTTAAGDSGNLAVRIAKASTGSVSFAAVKLERGSIATAFEPRPLPAERAFAHRYYYRIQNETALFLALSPGPAVSATRLFGMITLPERMRALPSVFASGLTVSNFTAIMDPITSLYVYSHGNSRELMLDCTAASALTANTWYFFGIGAGLSNYLAFSAEL